MSLHGTTSRTLRRQQRDARWKALVSAKDAQILDKDTRIIDLEGENSRLSDQLCEYRAELAMFKRPQRNSASELDGSEDSDVSAHEDTLQETSASKKRKVLHSTSSGLLGSKHNKPVLVTNSGSSPKSLSKLTKVQSSSKMTPSHFTRADPLTLVPTDEKTSSGVTTSLRPQQLHVPSTEHTLLPETTLLPAPKQGFTDDFVNGRNTSSPFRFGAHFFKAMDVAKCNVDSSF